MLARLRQGRLLRREEFEGCRNTTRGCRKPDSARCAGHKTAGLHTAAKKLSANPELGTSPCLDSPPDTPEPCAACGERGACREHTLPRRRCPGGARLIFGTRRGRTWCTLLQHTLLAAHAARCPWFIPPGAGVLPMGSVPPLDPAATGSGIS